MGTNRDLEMGMNGDSPVHGLHGDKQGHVHGDNQGPVHGDEQGHVQGDKQGTWP